MTDDNSRQELLARALHQLRSAIELLDHAAAPGQIAAHVDLAACQVEDLIETGSGVSLRQATASHPAEEFGSFAPGTPLQDSPAAAAPGD